MIPKIFHYIYLKGEKTNQFSLTHYLSIKSNIEVNKPEIVYFHCNEEPKNSCWFDKIKSHLQIVPTELISDYKGKTITRLSHQADILKVTLMNTVGGIYSDLDSIATNPLPEEYFTYDKPILTLEMNEARSELVGITAGFMMSPGHSDFFDKILDSYSEYDTNCSHGEFAIQRPLKIFLDNPELIHPRPAQDWIGIHFNRTEMAHLFLHKRLELIENSYQIHLWENITWDRFLKPMTVEHIQTVDTTFTLIARPFIKDL